ncbi:MAG: hypothetical protein H6509_13730 [Bryobacterales bacterium]|nr:hypothetical protein [Bryobacterales bacterium]
MATQVLIIWPQTDAAGRLCDSMLRCGLGLMPRILERYPSRREFDEMLEGGEHVKAVVVGMTSEERGLQLLRELDADAPNTLSVAAHTVESSELLRAVMRTGASDFLAPPFAVEDVRRAFESIAADPEAGPEGLLIAMMPCQGTDGASTIALHLAQGLSEAADRPALLVDCDVQGGVTAFRLGLQPKYTLADALAHADRLEEFLGKIVLRWRDFDVVCAPDSSLGLLGDHMVRLPRVLAKARKLYPAVVADLPAGIYCAGLDVLRAADRVMLVCTPSLTSLHLARRRVNEMLDSGVYKDRLHVVLNRNGSRRSMAPDDIERVLGMPVEHKISNDYTAAQAAALAGGLVSSESQLGRDLAALAVQISGNGEAPPVTHRGWKRILGLSS